MIEFDSNSIGTAAPAKQWIIEMERAFRDTYSGKVFVPQRLHIDHGRNTLLLMPCFGKDFFSTKLVSVFPENIKKKRPIIYGTVILNDGKTGEPLAVFDGGKLTAMRTAAVGSVGIKYLSPHNADALGVIGLGIQGFHQALFACAVRPIKKLYIYDSSQEIMSRFRERFKAFFEKVVVIRCANTEELCENSQIIITATNSTIPVVPKKESCWKGKTLIGIGSYKPDMKEFPDEVFKEIDQLFVDTTHGITESGDLAEPLSKGLIKREQIIPISAVLEQEVEATGKTRIFKSVGMAAFDLYGAILVYKRRKIP